MWFGGHRIWSITREFGAYWRPFPIVWMVQTDEQQPIGFPNDDGLLIIDRTRFLPKHVHPCPKSEEEMRFIVRHLSQPGEIILDCFCGTGTTLVAAKQLGRYWIGCDKSKYYCRVAKFRLIRTTMATDGNNGGDHDTFVANR